MQMTRVLIVDDDEDTREALRFLLEDAGYTVAEAADGVEGLEAIQASDVPLVVLLDYSMPRLNGIEVLQAVARDARLAAQHAFILVTAMSAYHFQAAEPVFATLSALIIVKPFEVDALLDAIASAARRLPAVPPSLA